MGTGYTRTNTADIQADEVVKSAPINAELNAVVNAFAASTGHSHDGTSAEGGPVTKLLGMSITIGDATAGTDITITFDGETNDGVMKWMEDEDYFQFDDDIVISTNEKLYFRDTGIYIHSNADGDLDIISDGTAADSIFLDSAGGITLDADTASAGITYADNGTALLQIFNSSTDVVIKTKVDSKDLIFQQFDGNEVMRIADNRKVYFFDEGGEHISSDGTDFTFASGNDINLTATADINIPANVGLTFGNDAEKIEGDGTDLTISGNNINLTATADVVVPANVGITFGTGEKIEGNNTDLTITSGAKINLTSGSTVDVTGNVEVSGTYTGGGLMTTGGSIVIPDAGNIGSASDTDAIAISSAGVVTLSATTEASATNTAALVVSGGVGIAKDVWIGDDLNLDSDAALLTFGADQDVSLTHVADTGILLNSTRQLQFGDSGTYIHQSADGVLDLVSDTEIEINATTVDLNGNLDVSGTYTGGGLMTTGGNIVIPDAGFIGSASDTDALQIEADGDIVMSQDLAVSGNITITGNLTVNGSTTTVDTTNTTIKDNLLELNSGASSNSNDVGIIIQRGSTGNDALIMWDESEDKWTLGTTTASAGDTGNLNITAGTLVADLEGSVTTAAQSNITSLGTLTALTVDDVAIDGKVITMTGSSSDTATITVGTNGTLAITTTDDSAAAANITITADGTFEAVGTTVTLDSSGGINLETDALSVGNGGDTDVVLTFNANTSDGVITWMEDEDYFQFSDNILMSSTQKIQFGDTASFIHQSADGTLTIDGEAIIDLNASTRVDVSGDIKVGGEVQTAKVAFTDGDDAITIADGGGITANTSLTLASGSTVTAINDEDNMSSNSDSALATQQSIKAYVDSVSAAANNVTGLNATGAELNTVADFSAVSVDTSTAIANNDAILMFDNGNNIGYRDVDLLVTYMESTIDTLSSLTTTGALNSGSITTGFGNIDNGSSTITTTGAVSVGALTQNGGAVFNESGADVDFRVESNNSDKMFVVDAGSDFVSISGANGLSEVLNGGTASINSVSANSMLEINTRSATDGHSGIINFIKAPNTSGTPTATADGEFLGRASFIGVDTGNTLRVGAQILAVQSGTDSDSVPTRLIFNTSSGASDPASRFEIATAETIVNEIGNSVDFRVESIQNANTVFVEGSSGNVSVGSGTPVPSASNYNTACLHIRQTGSSNVGSQLRLTTGQTGHNAGDGSFIAQWEDLNVYMTNQETGGWRFFSNGIDMLTMSSTTPPVFNDNSNDLDFRIESNDNAHMFFVDASTNRVGIGTNDPTGKLDVEDNTGSLSSTKDVTAEFMRADGSNNPRLQIRHSTAGTDIHHTYSSSAANLTFSNGGVESMRIGSAGDVSIGTTVSPPVGLTITADEDNHGVNLTRLADSGNPSDDEELGSYAFNSNAEASNSLASAEAKIVARCSQDHSGTVAGTDLEFYTKPDGTGPGSAPTQRLKIRQDARIYNCDSQGGNPHRFFVTNRVSIAGGSSKTHTITNMFTGYATLRIAYSDGNAQFAHVVVELGGHMFSSSNGYNAEVVTNQASTMSVSITKNNSSYVVTVNAGSNFAYGSIEMSGASFTDDSGATYAFS